MRKIISADSCRLKHSADKIFEAVSDVSVFKDWWSKNIKIKVLHISENRIGSKVEIRASGGWFRCEVVSVSPPNEVIIKYYEGVQKGEGVWKIRKAGDDESVVTYSIELEPVGIIPRFLSNFMNFSKLHSKSMKEIFQSLNEYLSTRNLN